MKKNLSIIFIFFLTVLIACTGNSNIDANGYYIEQLNNYVPYTEAEEKDMLIKNVIIYIGDGMGENHIAVAKILNGLNDGDLDLDKLSYKGSVITSCANEDVTDSAAAATAFATGIKTTQGYIGKDPNGNDIETIIEHAIKNGYKTGVITTKYLADATPASFSAHALDRYDKEAIVKSQIASKIDILLGGGYADYYKYETEILNAGYTLIKPSKDMPNLKESFMKSKADKIMGLFINSASGWVPMKDDIPTLADMTKKSLEILEKSDKGFILVVEEGQIDNYSTGSANKKQDIEEMAKRVIELDKAVRVGLNFARINKDTLVIVIADHETGGLEIREGKPDNSWFTTDYHTTVNVGVRAFGLHSRMFDNEIIDNTDICKYISDKMGFGRFYIK